MPTEIFSLEDQVERTPEKNFTKEDIITVVELTGESDFEVVHELTDEQGLYYLKIKVEGKEGESVVFDFTKKGEFSTHKSSGTSIHKAIYDGVGEFIQFPDHIAEYNYEKDEWIKL